RVQSEQQEIQQCERRGLSTARCYLWAFLQIGSWRDMLIRWRLGWCVCVGVCVGWSVSVLWPLLTSIMSVLVLLSCGSLYSVYLSSTLSMSVLRGACHSEAEDVP